MLFLGEENAKVVGYWLSKVEWSLTQISLLKNIHVSCMA